MRPTISWLLFALAMLFGFDAVAKPSTCNHETPQTCCEWWTVSIQADGTEAGALLEDSFDAMQKRLASEKQSDATLCAYWKDAKSCSRSYSAPTCSGAATGPVKEILDGFKKSVLGPPEKALTAVAKDSIKRYVEESEKHLEKLDKLDRLLKAGKKISDTMAAQKVGKVFQEYAKLLKAAAQRVKDLSNKLDLQWAGGGYGFAPPVTDLTELAAEIVKLRGDMSLSGQYPSPPHASCRSTDSGTECRSYYPEKDVFYVVCETSSTETNSSRNPLAVCYETSGGSVEDFKNCCGSVGGQFGY